MLRNRKNYSWLVVSLLAFLGYKSTQTSASCLVQVPVDKLSGLTKAAARYSPKVLEITKDGDLMAASHDFSLRLNSGLFDFGEKNENSEIESRKNHAKAKKSQTKKVRQNENKSAPADVRKMKKEYDIGNFAGGGHRPLTSRDVLVIEPGLSSGVYRRKNTRSRSEDKSRKALVDRVNRYRPGVGRSLEGVCSYTSAYFIEKGKRKWVLLLCPKEQRLNQSSNDDPPVKIDLDRRIFFARDYTYRFHEDNHLLFDELTLPGLEIPVLATSRLDILADFKYFFTMNFDENDILSEIRSFRQTGFGAEAQVGFALSVLFLEIDLDLLTDVSISGRRLDIPMTMHLPADAFKHLNENSSMSYSWLTPKDMYGSRLHLPKYERIAKEGYKQALSKVTKRVVRRHCGSKFCRFQIAKRSLVKTSPPFALNFKVPRSFVEKGFYPRYELSDVSSDNVPSSLRKYGAVSWQKERVEFNYAQFEKGNYRWNFSMTFGGIETCSDQEQIRVRRFQI